MCVSGTQGAARPHPREEGKCSSTAPKQLTRLGVQEGRRMTCDVSLIVTTLKDPQICVRMLDPLP